MNWKPGDQALCIKGGTRTTSGTTYTVISVHPKDTPVPGMPNRVWARDYLRLDVRYPNPFGASGARRFIRIAPENKLVLERSREHELQH